jgi:hypothetical protein
VLFISQEIGRERESTPRQYGDQNLAAKRTDYAIEGHRRDMIEDGAEFQTEATMGCQQGSTGHLRWHLAVTQDEVRQDREHRFARRTLDTPDGEPTQPDTDIMGMACQPPAAATGCLMFELKSEGQDKR